MNTLLSIRDPAVDHVQNVNVLINTLMNTKVIKYNSV